MLDPWHDYVDNDVKVRDHYHILENIEALHIEIVIYQSFIKGLNHTVPGVFHNSKSYDSHIIMQELGKFNFKINVIPNG